jgi:hypothetical protein
MTDSGLIPDLNTEQVEAAAVINVLASILAEKYKDQVQAYVKDSKMPTEDAMAKADEKRPASRQRLDRLQRMIFRSLRGLRDMLVGRRRSQSTMRAANSTSACNQ